VTQGLNSGADLTTRLADAILEWPEGKAAIQGTPFEQIARSCGTPFYLYDADVMVQQVQRLRRALPPGIDIYYSVKANPHPAVIEVFLQQGCGCEIASGGEYALARKAGAAPEKIVFAGPGKGQEELDFVVSQGIGEIHLESFEEIETLERIGENRNQTIAVAVRVNPSAGLGSGLLMGGQPTAFGFEEESLTPVVKKIRETKHLDLRGVHVYTGTQILDAEALLAHWQQAVEIAARVAELTGKPVSTVDFGGGLGIPYFAHEKELDVEAVEHGAVQIIDTAKRDPRLANCRFLIEPGRFLVGPAGVYVAAVRSVKTSRGTTFVVLDGGMNHHLAASGNLGQVVRRDYPIVNLSRKRAESDETVSIVGPLCTPIDTLGRKVKLPLPRAGDLIGILQSGAYGLSSSPAAFLSHPSPAEVMMKDGKFEVITPRRRTFGV